MEGAAILVFLFAIKTFKTACACDARGMNVCGRFAVSSD